MKPLIAAFLLTLSLHLPSFGATDCSIVEHWDSSELISVGDEEVTPESILSAATGQSSAVKILAQNQAPRSEAPEPASSPGKSQQPPATTGASPEQAGKPKTTAEKTADNLAKRRELARRNTRRLMGYTSTTVPPGK